MQHPPAAAIPPITADEARDIAAASLGHLARLILPEGRFIYCHDAGDIDARHDGYNLLRHCGTAWFMLRGLNTLGPGAAGGTPADALLRSIGFIGERLHPAPWADPARPSLGLVGGAGAAAGAATGGTVKLGGLGLALLMLGEAARWPALATRAPEVLPLGLAETVARLRQYALDEIDGDDFHHKRDFATGAVLPFRSDFYTGEAIFGLLMTGPASADLARVTAALMRRRYGWAEQSHWMAYAACEAVERAVVPEGLGIPYIAGLMEAILADARYRRRRQSTPIACRTEALTRVLLLDRAHPGLLPPGLVPRLRDHAADNLDILLGWYDAGQFWHGDTDTRVQIDFVQHSATAFLHWAMLG